MRQSNHRRDGSGRRNGAPPDDHSRLGPGDSLGDGRQHSGRLRFLRPARVRRFSWPNAVQEAACLVGSMPCRQFYFDFLNLFGDVAQLRG